MKNEKSNDKNKQESPNEWKDVMIHEEWGVEIMHIDEEEPIKNQPLFQHQIELFFLRST